MRDYMKTSFPFTIKIIGRLVQMIKAGPLLGQMLRIKILSVPSLTEWKATIGLQCLIPQDTRSLQRKTLLIFQAII